MDSTNGFEAWLNSGKGNALLAAVAIVVGLSFWKLTRPYAVPTGVLIMLMWFWKWKRSGGQV